MLGLTITISGTTHYLDLFETSEFKVNSSFAEIQNITQRNSTYSNSFYVPGSKENNDIFQHFFHLNSSFTDFDIRRKMDAILTYNGYEIMTGYVRLNFVNIENREVIYNITFYNEVGNLLANIGDKLMRDLDLSYMNHPYNSYDVAFGSLKDPDLYTPTGTTAYETGKAYWFLGHFGYEYTSGNTVNVNATPKLNFSLFSGGLFSQGYFDDPATPLQSYYMKPSVQFRELYHQIFEQAGYDIESNFMDTAYFKRFYLPQAFNSEGLYILQGENVEYQTIQSGDPITYTGVTTWTNVDPSYTQNNLLRVKLTPTVKDNISAHTVSGDYIMTINTTGIYTATLDISCYNNERIPDTVNLSAYLDIYFHQILSGTTTGNTIFHPTTVTIAPGGQGSLSYQFSWFANSGDTFAWDFLLSGLGTAVVTDFNFNIILGPKIVVGDFDYSKEFPDDKFKQIEFIQAVNNLFNMVVVPKVGEPRILIVEPIIDFIGKGAVLDWTRKIDHNEPIQISPTTTVINGVMEFNMQKDVDNGNEQFFNLNNLVFGSKEIDLNTDYKEMVTNFDSVFSNSVDYVVVNQQYNYATLPIYYVLETEEQDGQVQQFFRPFRTLPRPLFRGVNLPGRNIQNIDVSGTTFGEVWYLDGTQIDVFPINHRFTTYPFGVSGFSHYTNFNSTQYYDPTEAQFPSYGDMETVYYQDYIDDLIDADNRILDVAVYLTTEEFKSLQYNEKIFIDGNYYRINKIENFDYNTEKPVRVQLVKLTRDYEPHRKRCYTLTACDDPADIIYTNTDLTYGIFAFKDGFWKIGEICYQIEEIECGDYNYQPVKTTYSGSSVIPVAYTNCNCDTLSTILNVYDQVTPTPVPPSPSPTPTPTPTPCLCEAYTVDNNSLESQAFIEWIDCNGAPQTFTLDPDTGLSFCACFGSISTTGDTTTFDNGVCNPAPTPTPTPTATLNDCVEYTVENENPFGVSFQYVDCCTNQIVIDTLGAYQVTYVCSKQAPSGSVYWYINGACNVPCPSPTPTPTPSSTPLPPGPCFQYEITNTSSEGNLTFEYIPCGDCGAPPQVSIILPDGIASVCACDGSVAIISGTGNIVKGAECP